MSGRPEAEAYQDLDRARESLVDVLVALQSCPDYATHADKHDQAEIVVRAIDGYVRCLLAVAAT